VWSASVNGEAEKPALATAAEGATPVGPEVLIKIINSNRAFPVEIIYATPTSSLGWFGRVRVALPLPDMVATNSRLHVFLPDDLRYGEPTGNMDVVVQRQYISGEGMRAQVGGEEDATRAGLLIAVPQAGVRYEFQKLYANQGDREAWVAIPYATPWGGRAASLLALLGAGLFWASLALGVLRRKGIRPVSNWTATAGGLLGVALLAFAVIYLDTPPGGLVKLSVLLLLLLFAGGMFVRLRRPEWWTAWTSNKAAPEAWDPEEENIEDAGDDAGAGSVEDDEVPSSDDEPDDEPPQEEPPGEEPPQEED
jgi:hypothetical protein